MFDENISLKLMSPALNVLVVKEALLLEKPDLSSLAPPVTWVILPCILRSPIIFVTSDVDEFKYKILFKLMSLAVSIFVFKTLETSKLALTAILFFITTFLFSAVDNNILLVALSIIRLLLIVPSCVE